MMMMVLMVPMKWTRPLSIGEILRSLMSLRVLLRLMMALVIAIVSPVLVLNLMTIRILFMYSL